MSHPPSPIVTAEVGGYVRRLATDLSSLAVVGGSLKPRRTWPRIAAFLVAFVAAASVPLTLDVASRPQVVVEAVPLDGMVETVARYLEWRAPEALPAPLRRKVAAAVVEEARRVSMDPLFVLAVMEVESDFSPDALSNMNARGLMQLRPVTIREVERLGQLPAPRSEPVEVTEVRVGIRYLSALMKRYHHQNRALAAWNAGPGAVDRALREEGSIPDRWLKFARAVRREHRRLRKHLGPELPSSIVASAPRESSAVAAD